MVITTEARKKIVAALLASRQNFEGSDAKFAASFSIHKSTFSKLKNGANDENILKESVWISLARKLHVQLGDAPQWYAAETQVFIYITTQLALCQMESINSAYCGNADSGKSFAAEYYACTHKNAVYVDCSIYKTKQRLVRYIAQSFGLDCNGKYNDVLDDLLYYVQVIHRPIIILDEAGDLNADAFLEIKSLWNGTQHYCGWYMLGADGLKAKIDGGIARKKIGYTEIFSRFGGKFNNIIPRNEADRREFLLEELATVIEMNLPNYHDKAGLLMKCNYSLRNLYDKIIKIKRA